MHPYICCVNNEQTDKHTGNMNTTILTPADAASFSTNVVKACLRALSKDWSNLPLSEVINPRNRSENAQVLEGQISIMQDVLIERGVNPDTVC